MSETKYPLLSEIDSPTDLHKMSVEELPALCGELRQFIIDALSSNPGHFASSLGTIELTVALHYAYDVPTDRIVWDVGHQAYAHKILTGRRERFATNRKFGGLAPFPTPEESPCDAFVAGHASNSISAALGMAVADKLQGETARHIVAVIGDGALTGGLAFEGLNNMSSSPNNMLVVLNDNEMSIDPPTGGLSHYLTRITTSSRYNRLRYKGSKLLQRLNLLKNKDGIITFHNSIKSLLSREHNIFEGLSIRYFGPVDGHDVKELVRIFRTIKDFDGPKVLHVKTIKGKGFSEAEHNPTKWHAPGKFDPDTELLSTPPTDRPLLYQEIFGQTLLDLAEQNPAIVGVTPAMPTGCSMNVLAVRHPERVFDVGIAEGHAVTFSAGMAKEGLIPFCNIYSSFAQRAYDNVIHDVALLGLPVVLCLDRAGLVGHDGATHHGMFDLAALRPIPHLTIASPLNGEDLRNLMYTAQCQRKGAFVIRYPRGAALTSDRLNTPMCEYPIGRGVCLRTGRRVAVLSLGSVGNVVKETIEKMCAQRADFENAVAHYDVRFLKPLDNEMMDEVLGHFTQVITVEDGVRNGGLGSAVAECIAESGKSVELTRLGLPDNFVPHGSPEELYALVGLDSAAIARQIAEAVERTF